MEKRRNWRRIVAVMFTVTLVVNLYAADAQTRIRTVTSQADLDAITGNGITIFSKNITDWKAADTGETVDGIIIASGADVKLVLPGENIPKNPGMTAKDANTFYIPAGKFVRVSKNAKFQLRSGLSADDYDNTTLIVGGVGTSNPKVSDGGESVLNKKYAYAIEVEAGGLFIVGSDSAAATDKTGGLPGFPVGRPDDATLWLADGKSIGADGKPSNYAGAIKVDGELRISSAGGAGVAKIWTFEYADPKGTTLIGKGKLSIYGKHEQKGAALFAINEFDRGELSNGMDTTDVPNITLGTIEIIADGIEGIFNPDGSIDGSPGYRNNANAGFYYVGGTGLVDVGKMIVKSTNTDVTADTTVALANFNTAAGILGGKVTDVGPTFKLGEVEIYNAAKNDADGPLAAIYTVQGVATATVKGAVKIDAPNGGAAAIVATGHGRWTGPEKTNSIIGSVIITSAGKNAFFQSNTFEGYGTQVKGDVTIRANYDGTIAPFVGRVPPGPGMGRGGTKGVAPEAEDVRDEQFVVQGGAVTVKGRVTIENAHGTYYALFKNEAKTRIGSLSVNGEKLPKGALASVNTGKVRVENTGSLTIDK